MTPSERAIRKATDSDISDLTPEHYQEVLSKLSFASSFEHSMAMNFLMSRIFENAYDNPCRVFKSLDLAKYMLLNGDYIYKEKLLSYNSRLKSLSRVKFKGSKNCQFSTSFFISLIFQSKLRPRKLLTY